MPLVETYLHRKLRICLMQNKCSHPKFTKRIVLILSLRETFFFLFFFFWMIVTGPLKRLPMYLSYRGSDSDVVWKQSFEKKNLFFFFEMKFLFFFFFFWKESNLIRMRFFEVLSFPNEQKVILCTTSSTNHNAQLLTRSHWLQRIWNH